MAFAAAALCYSCFVSGRLGEPGNDCALHAAEILFACVAHVQLRFGIRMSPCEGRVWAVWGDFWVTQTVAQAVLYICVLSV